MNLAEQAHALLRANDRGGYTVPTAGLYPFQWNWDASVTALGWMHVDPARAWEELRWLFKGQWQGGPNDGFLAQINFHAPSDSYFPGPDEWGTDGAPGTQGIGTRTSSISQPPLHATMVRWMWQLAAARPADDPVRVQARAEVAALIPRLLAHHRWWYRCRDPLGTGLVVNIHPWETGMDNSAAWDDPLAAVPRATRPYRRRDLGHVDASMRPSQAFYDRMVHLMDFNRAKGFDPMAILAECPYQVQDIGIVSILQRASIDLADLCAEFGLQDAAGDMRERVARTRTAVQALWSVRWQQYVSRDALTGRLLEVPTSAGLLAAYAGFANDIAPTVRAWLAETPWGLPSTRSGCPAFEARRYWRGPVWQHINMLIAAGLREQRHADLAGVLQERSAALLEKAGFHEYFDPLTGEGLGGGNFSWTAATYLHWLAPDRPVAASAAADDGMRGGPSERSLRPWGWYETLSEGPGHRIKRIHVAPGRQISLQKHHHRAEHWVVVRGLAQVTVGAQVVELALGQHVDIEVGEVHRLANRTQDPVEIVEVQFGDYLGEDDIVRLHDDYGRS